MQVDREAASDLGVPVGTVADTLRVLVGGLPISKFRDGDEQYDVWLRAEARDRGTAQDLYQLTLPSPTVGLVKLASLARLVDERGPTEIERLGRERIVTVLGNPEGIPLGEAVSRAEKILQGMNLPAQYSYIFTGQAKTLGETGYYFLIAFMLSITFMYLILAAQFESWTQPIAILMALPVTIPFGMLSLVLWRTPMDLYAMFGLFMLVGIVKKNGILQVDATNQLRARGYSRHDAIVEANHTRLRPILMTTVMLVAAMVPIAFGQGPGSGARASMAKVIIGGQMLSLVLALLVTPVFYALLDMVVNLARRLGIRFAVEQRAGPIPSRPPSSSPRAKVGELLRLPLLPLLEHRAGLAAEHLGLQVIDDEEVQRRNWLLCGAVFPGRQRGIGKVVPSAGLIGVAQAMVGHGEQVMVQQRPIPGVLDVGTRRAVQERNGHGVVPDAVTRPGGPIEDPGHVGLRP